MLILNNFLVECPNEVNTFCHRRTERRKKKKGLKKLAEVEVLPQCRRLTLFCELWQIQPEAGGNRKLGS